MLRAAVFVVEDQVEQARALQRLLQRMGHEVTIETNGVRALAILKGQAEFDVTFLDILMPDMTGGQIYNELYEHAPGRLKRLVFLTGMAYMVENWLKQTGLPVIEKPASQEVLAATIEQYAQLSCSRGPKLLDHCKPRLPMAPQKPSHPELPSLYDDTMEIDSSVIDLAERSGLPKEIMTELRIRHLHSSHKALKTNVGEVMIKVDKVDETATATKNDLGQFKAEITTTFKTSQKWVAGIIVGAGALAWIAEHVWFKK